MSTKRSGLRQRFGRHACRRSPVRWTDSSATRRYGFLTLLSVLTLAAPSSVTAQAEPVVTQAVQVTPDPDPVRAHSSPQLARNPDNGELVIVESNPRGSSQQRSCDVHLSTDGGQHWFRGGALMQEPFTDCSLHSDYGPLATLAFAGDGTLYVAFVANDPSFAGAAFSSQSSGGEMVQARQLATNPFDDMVAAHPPRRVPRNVFLARSSDGGRSFDTSPVFIGAEEPAQAPAKLPPEGENKGPMLAVDPDDPSQVHVGWRQGDLTDNSRKLRTVIATSTDGGRSFGEPIDVSDERGGDYPALAVGSSGTVHAVYWARDFSPTPLPDDAPAPVAPIQYVRSTDRGETWSDPVPIDPGNQSTQRPPVLAVDPASDALYLAWYSHAEAMNDTEDFDGDLDIFARASDDGGDTWSDRSVVNDDGSGADQYEPGIAVSPGGRVDVAWYDFRNSPDGGRSDIGLSDVYYASSDDGGRTFMPNLRVNDRGIDRSIGVWSNNIDSRFNVGLDSANEVAHVAWQDSRNGRPDTNAEDIYYASVHLDGVATNQAEDAGLPSWALIGVGVVLGMGVAMVMAAAATRRLRRS